MLDERGRISFTRELLDLVDRLWSAFEEAEGQPAGPRERLVGLAYIVAALRQDIDNIWLQLLAMPELQGLDLPAALRDELGEMDPELLAALKAEMQQRGWLGGGEP